MDLNKIRLVVPDSYVAYPSLLDAVRDADRTIKWCAIGKGTFSRIGSVSHFMISTDPALVSYSSRKLIRLRMKDPVYILYIREGITTDHHSGLLTIYHSCVDRAHMKQYIFYDIPTDLTIAKLPDRTHYHIQSNSRNYATITLDGEVEYFPKSTKSKQTTDVKVANLCKDILLGRTLKKVTMSASRKLRIHAENHTVSIYDTNKTVFRLDALDDWFVIISIRHGSTDYFNKRILGGIRRTIADLWGLPTVLATCHKSGRPYRVRITLPTFKPCIQITPSAKYVCIGSDDEDSLYSFTDLHPSGLPPYTRLFHLSNGRIQKIYGLKDLTCNLESVPANVLNCYQEHLRLFGSS